MHPQVTKVSRWLNKDFSIIQLTKAKKVEDKIEIIKLTSSKVTFRTKNLTANEKWEDGFHQG